MCSFSLSLFSPAWPCFPRRTGMPVRIWGGDTHTHTRPSNGEKADLESQLNILSMPICPCSLILIWCYLLSLSSRVFSFLDSGQIICSFLRRSVQTQGWAACSRPSWLSRPGIDSHNAPQWANIQLQRCSTLFLICWSFVKSLFLSGKNQATTSNIYFFSNQQWSNSMWLHYERHNDGRYRSCTLILYR